MLKPIRIGIASLMFMLGSAVALLSQQPAGGPDVAPDPQIAAAIREISVARIQQTVEKLSGFTGRQTLSAGRPGLGDQGIDAAAIWIQSQFERYSKDCGDCLQVRTDQFIQEPVARVPEAVKITKVYAVLKEVTRRTPAVFTW